MGSFGIRAIPPSTRLPFGQGVQSTLRRRSIRLPSAVHGVKSAHRESTERPEHSESYAPSFMFKGGTTKKRLRFFVERLNCTGALPRGRRLCAVSIITLAYNTLMSDDDLEAAKHFRDLLADYTVRLVGLDANQYPVAGSGSGLLWQHESHLTLLTVYHNFRNGRRWMETNVTADGKTLLLELGGPGSIQQARPARDGGTELKDTDFAWINLDIEALSQKLRSGGVDPKEVNLPVYRGDFSQNPASQHIYGFAASIPKGYHPPSGDLVMRQACELYMRYDGVQSEGDYAGSYRFALARNHQGHDYYHGSSGAPIADEEGHIVALVRSGDAKAGIVFGCPLQIFARYVTL